MAHGFEFHQSEPYLRPEMKRWRVDFTAQYETVTVQTPIFVEESVSEEGVPSVARKTYKSFMAALSSDAEELL